MLILAWISIGIGAIIAIVGVIQLWRLRRARFSELIANVGQMWDSEVLTEARQLANKLADEGNLRQRMDEANRANSKEFFILMRIPNFFDSVGAMVEHGDLSEKVAKELFDKPATRYWDLYGNALSAIDLEGVSHFRKLVEKFRS